TLEHDRKICFSSQSSISTSIRCLTVWIPFTNILPPLNELCKSCVVHCTAVNGVSQRSRLQTPRHADIIFHVDITVSCKGPIFFPKGKIPIHTFSKILYFHRSSSTTTNLASKVVP